VSRLLDQYENASLMSLSFEGVRSDAVLSFEGNDYHPSVTKCLRIWPQDNDTEGFFVAKIRKKRRSE
jgi:tRNA (cytosine49-C5)-methyltransferase